VKETAEKPAPARLRRLSEEEIALWIEVAKSVARRRGAILPTLAARQPAAAPAADETPASPAVTTTKPRRPAGPPPLAPLERRLKRDLARGRAVVDSVLDLHGMTQAEAHHALRGFLFQAQIQDFRLVIVITGKGARAPQNDADWFHETGVLRRLVPHWLREPDLRATVLGFEEAGPGHGGAGALYVRLRRRDRR
jgi:DNA-nicking Smr family endonuclease